MTGKEFADFLKELRYAYELRLPEKDICDHWFGRIKFIPGEALPWISDRILSNNERFPRKFDALVSTMFREWLAANPDKREHQAICPECDHGFVTIMETVPELYGDTLVPMSYACSRCRAFMKGSAKLTKSEARKRGLNLIDAEAPFAVAPDTNLNPQPAIQKVANAWKG